MSSFGILSSNAMQALEQRLYFAEARHRLILSNIANADTPAYRRMDLDGSRFERALQRKLAAQRPRAAASATGRAHSVISTGPAALSSSIVARLDFSGPVRHDENDISPEREMAALAMNAGKFSRDAALLRKMFGQLRAAIAEKPDLAG